MKTVNTDMRIAHGIPYGVISALDELALIAHIASQGYTYWGDTPDFIDIHGRNVWPRSYTYKNFTISKDKPTTVNVHTINEEIRLVITYPFDLVYQLHNSKVIENVEKKECHSCEQKPQGQLRLF